MLFPVSKIQFVKSQKYMCSTTIDMRFQMSFDSWFCFSWLNRRCSERVQFSKKHRNNILEFFSYIFRCRFNIRRWHLLKISDSISWCGTLQFWCYRYMTIEKEPKLFKIHQNAMPNRIKLLIAIGVFWIVKASFLLSWTVTSKL